MARLSRGPGTRMPPVFPQESGPGMERSLLVSNGACMLLLDRENSAERWNPSLLAVSHDLYHGYRPESGTTVIVFSILVSSLMYLANVACRQS